jgi:hypothetical protein
VIPGGLFEVALALWLLIKGFEPEAFDKESAWPRGLLPDRANHC